MTSAIAIDVFRKPLNYEGAGTVEDRVAKLENRVRGLALMFWTVIIGVMLLVMLVTASLYALWHGGVI
jgi:hypothetical protein